jgi:hypothetical protein
LITFKTGCRQREGRLGRRRAGGRRAVTPLYAAVAGAATPGAVVAASFTGIALWALARRTTREKKKGGGSLAALA